MNHISPYHTFEDQKNAEYNSAVNKKTGERVWKKLDATADRIHKEGYGKPVRDLIASEPMFGVMKYGKQLCEPDVLFDRFHKLKQRNQVLKNITFAERMVMLLLHWDSLGAGFNHIYNPKKLPFSKWVLEPQILYRGMNESAYHALGRQVLDHQPFYSFSFLVDVAKRFTSAAYASGTYVPYSSLHGYVVSTEARPIDFHIFMGGGLSDEMEVVLKSPVKIKLVGSVNMKEVKGKDLS